MAADESSESARDRNSIPSLSPDPVPRPRSLAHRSSAYSHSRSRQTSAVFPLFHSSLTYALVRDFAYPPFHPMHYGPVEDTESTASTSGGDFDTSRRVSDPPPWDASNGPWRDSSYDNAAQPLPSTSFGPGDFDDDFEDDLRSSRRLSRHRKSKSYTSIDDARGRRRSSRDAKSTLSAASASQAFDRNDSGFSSEGQAQNNRGPGYDISSMDNTKHPPFREDGESVPYSPSSFEDHRPESASLDESFAGPSLVLYDFKPENDNELGISEGQVIQVGYRHGQGWLVAMNPETGEQGLVPEEYVRLLRDIEGGWSTESLDEASMSGYGPGEVSEDTIDEGDQTPTKEDPGGLR